MQFYFSCTNNSHQYNVLFIAVDDLNDWVGFMDGNQQTQTPHMDNFADKATEGTKVQLAKTVSDFDDCVRIPTVDSRHQRPTLTIVSHGR